MVRTTGYISCHHFLLLHVPSPITSIYSTHYYSYNSIPVGYIQSHIPSSFYILSSDSWACGTESCLSLYTVNGREVYCVVTQDPFYSTITNSLIQILSFLVHIPVQVVVSFTTGQGYRWLNSLSIGLRLDITLQCYREYILNSKLTTLNKTGRVQTPLNLAKRNSQILFQRPLNSRVPQRTRQKGHLRKMSRNWRKTWLGWLRDLRQECSLNFLILPPFHAWPLVNGWRYSRFFLTTNWQLLIMERSTIDVQVIKNILIILRTKAKVLSNTIGLPPHNPYINCSVVWYQKI